MSSNRVKTATGEEFLRRRYCHWTWTDFKIHGESGFLTLVIDYEGTVRLEVELADLFAWVRDVRRTLSGLNMISILKPQGCRCAPTAGLKLANAFGVIFKLLGGVNSQENVLFFA